MTFFFSPYQTSTGQAGGKMNPLNSLVTAIPNQGMLGPYEKVPIFFRFSPRYNQVFTISLTEISITDYGTCTYAYTSTLTSGILRQNSCLFQVCMHMYTFRWTEAKEGFRCSQQPPPLQQFALFMHFKAVGASEGFQDTDQKKPKSNAEGEMLNFIDVPC